MDLRKERRRGNALIGVLLILIFLAIVATMYILKAQIQTVPASAPILYENLDERVTPLSKSVFSTIASKNAPDEFSYSIKEDIRVTENAAKVLIENPSKNLYLMAVEFVLNEDETVVLRTGYIPPGYQIEDVMLEHSISQGEHKATAIFYAIDPQSRDILGMLEQPITITMK